MIEAVRDFDAERYHNGAAVAAQRVHQQFGEHRVAVGRRRARRRLGRRRRRRRIGQRVDALGQTGQRLVDGHALTQPVAAAARVRTLAASVDLPK